jgi:fatty acid desaturase
MIQNWRDLQTLVYMLALPALATLLWLSPTVNPFAYGLLLALSFTTPTMNHNHAHCPIWRSERLNRVTDLWFTLLQGHPGYLFREAHIGNHHRYINGPLDRTRTSCPGPRTTCGAWRAGTGPHSCGSLFSTSCWWAGWPCSSR